MDRYLIELPHDDEYNACVRALDALRAYGSHFVTHADWGCSDGVHCGWLVCEVESRDEALRAVPPQMRQDARITKLNRFSGEQIERLVAELGE